MPSTQAYLFRCYSLLSVFGTAFLINKAMNEQQNFYNRVISLTSQKLNLVLLLNCVVAILSNAASIFVYVFFTQIRTLEAKVNFSKLTIVVSRRQIPKKSVLIPIDVYSTEKLVRCL